MRAEQLNVLSLLFTIIAEPPKPSLPKVMLEYVDTEALDWLTNLVDIDP